MGSPGCMCPRSRPVATCPPSAPPATSILGVVLYELLTGQQPFLGAGGELIRQTADPTVGPPPREIAPDVPLGWRRSPSGRRAKTPAARYPTADLAVDLQRWLKGDPVSAPFRLRGEAVRVCPDCERPTADRWAKCRLCRRTLKAPMSRSPTAADLTTVPAEAEGGRRCRKKTPPTGLRAIRHRPRARRAPTCSSPSGRWASP